MIDWPAELDREIARVCGSEDEADEELNGDPTSTLGEDDEEGFDDGPDEPEPLFVDDDGFEDAEGEEDGDWESDDEDDC